MVGIIHGKCAIKCDVVTRLFTASVNGDSHFGVSIRWYERANARLAMTSPERQP